MNVLLSGVTGYLGSGICSDLLENGNNLFAISRPTASLSARDRAKKALSLLGADTKKISKRLNIFKGDITKKEFGLSFEEIQRMKSEGVDEIWHAAGSVSFADKQKNNTFAVNLQGTINMLELAEYLGVKKIHYVGTFYNGNENVEFHGNNKFPVERFNNPYEESKYFSKKYLQAWSEKNPETEVFIYEPSIVVGDSQMGRYFNTSGYYMYMKVYFLVQKMQKRGKLSLPQSEDGKEAILPIVVPGRYQAEINLVSIDYVIKIMMKIRKKGVPGVYPIVNTRPPIYGELLQNGLKVFGIRGVSVFDRAKFEDTPEALKKIESMVADGMGAYGPYIERTYPSDPMHITIEQLGDDFTEHPEIDESMVNKFMTFAIDNNFDIKV